MMSKKISKDILQKHWLRVWLMLLVFALKGQAQVVDTTGVVWQVADSVVTERTTPDSVTVSPEQAALMHPLKDENEKVYVSLPEEKQVAPIDTMPLFRPDPTKAVWRSALLPGLGQIYNRKYWKLPILYGGMTALVYAYTWNGRYYKDYSTAYRDLIDGNPNTNSFLDFLPPGSNVSDYSEEWLRSTFQRKTDYYRRSRDLSIIGAIGLYLVSILDAYVDAQLYDFDISPDLSIRVEPKVMPSINGNSNFFGMQCNINF